MIAIDADSFAYKLAAHCVVDGFYSSFDKKEDIVEDDSMAIFDSDSADSESDIIYMHVLGTDVQCSLSLAEELVANEINAICKALKDDDYVCYLTANGRNKQIFRKYVSDREPEPNFRYKIAKDLQHDYKHNRKSDPPAGYDAIITAIVTKFNGIMIEGAEADDIVVALCNQKGYKVAAIDKDVLNQSVGTHWNYNKEELITVSKKDAIFYKYFQAIVGDPSDGYKGVPGIGPKGASSWINNSMSEKELCENVIAAFESKGLGAIEAIATIRLADMTQCKFIDDKEWLIELYEPSNYGVIP